MQNEPTVSPAPADYSVDPNVAAENLLAGALGMVPEVGSVLAALVYIFWPQPNQDVWSQLEAKVEELIDEKISDLVFNQTKDGLAGLNNVLADYLTTLKTNDLAVIPVKWLAAKAVFEAQAPNFQASGYETLLLPLYAQFTNLYLSLLRDGVMAGASWGWNEAYQQQITQELKDTITFNLQYADGTYVQGYVDLANKTPANNHQCQPFRALNAYRRQMTLLVSDFMLLWFYFDVTKYPKPVEIYLDREIYSDPVGTCDDSGPIVLPTTPPTQPLWQLTVWGGDRIDAVQLTYPAGGGPDGVTQTARMGDQSGGSNVSPDGGDYYIPLDNPITVAGGTAGDILNSFTFTFADKHTWHCGGNYAGGTPFSFSYDFEILSSVHINGISEVYGSADCAVFGFKFPLKKTPAQQQHFLRTYYIATPTEPTPELLTAANLDELATTENWAQQRQAHWAAVARQARQQ